MAVDKNNDGLINQEELAAAPASLMALDQNGDRRVTKNEAHPEGHPEGPGMRMTRGPENARMGRPQGTRLTTTERSQSATNFDAVQRIMALDKNGDKQVSRDEIPDTLKDLMRADANRDGFITRGESRDFVERLRPSANDGTGKRRKRGF